MSVGVLTSTARNSTKYNKPKVLLPSATISKVTMVLNDTILNYEQPPGTILH